MTVNVTQSVSGDNRPYTETVRFDSCQKDIDLYVPCPSGESRYVVITSVNTSSGTYVSSGSPYTFAITADATYDLTINDDSGKATGELSSFFVEVSLTVSTPVFYTLYIPHYHTGTAGC